MLIEGSYQTFRRISSCFAVLILLCIACSLVQSGACEAIPAGDTERVIIYVEPGNSTRTVSFPDNSSLAVNCSVVLQAPDLGFLVADIPVNNSRYYMNEILTLPRVTGVECDNIRTPESLYQSLPDDPDISDLWAFNRTHVPQAWTTLSSHPDVPSCTIAILDTGIDLNHEDLSGVIVPGGFDWVENSSVILDTDGHGTFLAGITGAVAGNGKGGAGVAHVSLLPERVGTTARGIFASRSAMAIQHAADAGARIILMGYGGPGQSPAEEAAITYAAKKGCILIAPAGNSASNEGHYPSDYYEVISVGSTARTDGLSYFSNYGIFVELVSPGEEIISTWPGNRYQAGTGTSPAAALVAGAAALVLAADPTLDRDQVREVLTTTAHDLGRTGRDIYYGYGLLDIGEAVKSAEYEKVRVKKEYSGPVEIGMNAGEENYQNNSAESALPDVKRSSSGDFESLQLQLQPGWNFISLPSVPGSGKTSGDIFRGINTDGHTIWKFDAVEQDWISVEKKSNISPLEGFLIYSDRQVSIPLVLAENSGKEGILVNRGWNLIGSPSRTPVTAAEGLAGISPGWSSLLLFNSTTQSYDTAVIPGANGTHSDTRILPAFSAYWIFMNTEGKLGGT
jgi:subtilisin family serine protease